MKYSLIVFLAIFLSCGQKDNKTTIRIYSVDINITTIVSINCNNFLDSFDNAELKIDDFKERSTIDDFQRELRTLERDNEKRDPDTRAIVIVKNEIATDTLCADRFTVKYRDKFYVMTDDLSKIIWRE
jgi:adenosyl cobinamide kinase/adenosyl cobinamide phosphate guanylyltransferase